MKLSVLSSLNIPLQRGDLVVYVSSRNGFIEVKKGKVIQLMDYYKTKIIAINGKTYMYGSPDNIDNSMGEIRINTVYGRMLTHVSDDLAKLDPDFDALLNNAKTKKLFG